MKETDLKQYQHYRSIAKVLNFSLLYDMSIPSLHTRLIENEIVTDYQSATQFYQKWHSTFSEVKPYINKMVELFEKEKRGNVF